MRTFGTTLLGLAISSTLTFVLPAKAEEYPIRPITLVAAYNPGGSYDTIARLVAQKLIDKWGQQVIVENSPGAGSLIGTEAAVNAEPDGYTIIIFGNNHAILPAVRKNISFDIQKAFDPVGLIATLPGLILVNPTVEAETLEELIVLAKAEPGGIIYGSGGAGGSTHLGLESFSHAAGIEMLHVPYKAGVPATMDLIAGETHAGLLNVSSAKAHVESGALRPLAITSAERSSDFPDVPTVRESGVEGYSYLEFYGFAVPAGTPRDIVDKLNGALNEIVDDPEIYQRLISMGAKPNKGTPEEFGAFLAAEIERNKAAVERAGVQLD